MSISHETRCRIKTAALTLTDRLGLPLWASQLSNLPAQSTAEEHKSIIFFSLYV
jgi:hypothetical protein